MVPLWDGLCSASDALGLDRALGRDEVFRQLVLARIIQPTSKLDSLRVLAEVGVEAMSYRTLNRRLRGYAEDGFRRKLATACAQHTVLGLASLVLYDVSTLYFETDQGDGFREPGFSKERRLEPQITIGLLTDAAGFPLTVEAFEGRCPRAKRTQCGYGTKDGGGFPSREDRPMRQHPPVLALVVDHRRSIGRCPCGERDVGPRISGAGRGGAWEVASLIAPTSSG